MTDMIRVINHNDETLKGRFDGEDFRFPKDKPVDIPYDAARHIFALGDDDKAQALNMLGWLVPGKDTYAAALKKLDCITFLMGKTVYPDEPEGDAPAPVSEAAPAPRTRGKKTGEGPYVAGAGGESGGGGATPSPANP